MKDEKGGTSSSTLVTQLLLLQNPKSYHLLSVRGYLGTRFLPDDWGLTRSSLVRSGTIVIELRRKYLLSGVHTSLVKHKPMSKMFRQRYTNWKTSQVTF